MKVADLAPVADLLVTLVEAITSRGEDPKVVIPAITRSYQATGRADGAIADYIDRKFPDA